MDVVGRTRSDATSSCVSPSYTLRGRGQLVPELSGKFRCTSVEERVSQAIDVETELRNLQDLLVFFPDPVHNLAWQPRHGECYADQNGSHQYFIAFLRLENVTGSNDVNDQAVDHNVKKSGAILDRARLRK